MTKKTLDEKIKQVVWIFSIGTPIYIVVSLLLLNDYSSEATFDPEKVYDVIKDALTLAATFLAPVAAFVLFTDWREQFVAQVKHRVSTRMYDIQFRLLRKLYYARSELISGLSSETGNEREDLFLMRKEFDNNIEEIRRLCGDSEFTRKSQQASEEFKKLSDLLSLIESHKKHYAPNDIPSSVKSLIKKDEDEFDKKFTALELCLKDIDSWKIGTSQ